MSLSLSRPSSAKRKPLHQRTQSQNNESPRPSSTLRLVPTACADSDPVDENDVNIYFQSPYPTKPAHILAPTLDTSQGPSANTPPFQHASRDNISDHSVPSLSELSSTLLTGNASSLTWKASSASSSTSVPQSISPHVSDDENQLNSSGSSSVATLPPLPRTIRVVRQEERTPSPSNSSSGECSIIRAYSSSSDDSSSNVVRLGYTSSPNLVPLNTSSSSPTVLHDRGSHFVRAERSDSSLYSLNSFGTARRYPTRSSRRNQTALAHYILEDQPSSQTPSIPSSPPLPVLKSFESTSSFAPSDSVCGPPAASSVHSAASSSEIQAIIESGLAVQYPSLRAASTSSLWADTSVSLIPAPLMIDRPSGRWNPHLSTVSSVENQDQQLDFPFDPAQTTTEGMNEVEKLELQDRITHLQSPPILKHKTSGTLSYRSSISRLDSIRSLSRPGSSASGILTYIPAWAKIYYQHGGAAFLSAVSLVESSRPSTPREAQPVTWMPITGSISRPRARPRQNSRPELVSKVQEPEPVQKPKLIMEQEQIVLQPEPIKQPKPVKHKPSHDPRTHWAGIVQVDEITSQISEEPPVRKAWSPHLYPDKRTGNVKRSIWKAPSIDEAAEDTWGRRNMQIAAFCLGFIFPLAWLIGAFLPLPLKPPSPEDETINPDIEKALRHRGALADSLRYENARWWRNLNRWMTPVGLVIIIIIITLSVLGSRNAL
ncbi:hypothetical protein FQN57_006362 [Myotisia sp. PD_48]|nr:hypothetical protein FQN57_006362 [Myotisia sp. PD_48]